VTGLIAAVMAATVPMTDLHHMVSIGTLFAFVVVSASVLIMRYKTEEAPEKSVFNVLQLSVGLIVFCFGLAHDFSQPIQLPGFSIPTPGLFLQSLSLGPIALTLAQALKMLAGLIIMAQPLYTLFTWKQVDIPTGFKCPWVPLIPVVAMAGNIYMMVNLNIDAWIRLVVWLGVGLALYFLYGQKHSKLAG
jgi:APA family basic amino acid/polyamine antiporter